MKNKIIFDMDGVLINTEPLHYEIWKQLLSEIGIDIEYKHYKGCIGSTRKYLYELIQKYYGVDLSSYSGIPERFAEIKDAYLEKNGVPQIDGVVEVINKLYNNGYVMAVASSSPQSYIEKQLKSIGIADCFEIMLSAENVSNPKPAPDVFLAAAKALNYAPEECIVIEDSHNGSLAAKAAGMTCFGFLNPDSGEQDLSSADKTFYPFYKLLELL